MGENSFPGLLSQRRHSSEISPHPGSTTHEDTSRFEPKAETVRLDRQNIPSETGLSKDSWKLQTKQQTDFQGAPTAATQTHQTYQTTGQAGCLEEPPQIEGISKKDEQPTQISYEQSAKISDVLRIEAGQEESVVEGPQCSKPAQTGFREGEPYAASASGPSD